MTIKKYPKFTVYEDDYGEWHVKFHKNGTHKCLRRFIAINPLDYVEITALTGDLHGK